MRSPESKDGINIKLTRRQALIAGAIGVGGLAVGAFALLRPKESQPSVTLTPSTQTQKPEVKKAPAPETVARASAEAVINQDINRVIDLMAPDKKDSYRNSPQARDGLKNFLDKYRNCQGARLIGESTVRDDRDTFGNSIKRVTFIFDKKCQVQFFGALFETQNIEIILEFANNQYYFSQVR